MMNRDDFLYLGALAVIILLQLYTVHLQKQNHDIVKQAVVDAINETIDFNTQ